MRERQSENKLTQKEHGNMKTNKMNRKNNGFTLIEMVGVLAVIAILAALLVPKIFAAINDSRFSNTVASLNSCKTATMDYFGKKGNFPVGAVGAFGTTLLTEGFMERPFSVKIGDSSTVSVLASTADVPGATHCYSLDGAAAGFVAGSTVVEVVLSGVEADDAWELSKRIDGQPTADVDTTLTPAAAGNDTKGRVTYVLATKVCSIYLAHK
jgi:prepilin-type N-terminal cleavage/methylation domain-containing protein